MDRQHFPLVSIEPKKLEELRDKVSDFPEVAFRAAVSQYVAIRDEANLPETLPPNAVRDELDSLTDQVLVLTNRLHRARHSAIREFISQSADRLGEKDLLHRLDHDLGTLLQIAENARRTAERLVKIKPWTLLIMRLARTLGNLNLPVTAKPQDRLVLLFLIALEAAGETGEAAPKDAVGTVRKALATLKKKHLLV